MASTATEPDPVKLRRYRAALEQRLVLLARLTAATKRDIERIDAQLNPSHTWHPGRPVRLPLYPFHRTSHWISAGTPTPPAGGPAMPNEAPAPAPSDAPSETAPARDRLVERVLQQVREQAADQLSLTVEDVAPEVAFFDLGADSLLMINMIRRLEKPHKRYKVGAEDFRNIAKRKQYIEAYNDMLDRTDTDHAPWHVIAHDDKRWARLEGLKCIADIIGKGVKITPQELDPEVATAAFKLWGWKSKTGQ